jgi:hypothetical protein
MSEMSKLLNNWERMFQALEAYKARHGTCDVPASYPEDPSLGRWVAVQRYRRKMNRLEEELVTRLDQAGFIWAPGDRAWERGLAQLVDFKNRFGNCDVPAQCTTHPNLGSWVANQRHRKKTGKLSVDRIKRLDEAGFKWFIYGMDGDKRKASPQPEPASPRKGKTEQLPENRIYNLGHDEFIQYDGQGPEPRELLQYAKSHGGNFPPFIPLPSEPTRFVMNSDGFGKDRIIKWSGKSRLSEEILDYVRENGCLPPRKY